MNLENSERIVSRWLPNIHHINDTNMVRWFCLCFNNFKLYHYQYRILNRILTLKTGDIIFTRPISLYFQLSSHKFIWKIQCRRRGSWRVSGKLPFFFSFCVSLFVNVIVIFFYVTGYSEYWWKKVQWSRINRAWSEGSENHK